LLVEPIKEKTNVFVIAPRYIYKHAPQFPLHSLWWDDNCALETRRSSWSSQQHLWEILSLLVCFPITTDRELKPPSKYPRPWQDHNIITFLETTMHQKIWKKWTKEMCDINQAMYKHCKHRKHNLISFRQKENWKLQHIL
jgi:hypothetical protein